MGEENRAGGPVYWTVSSRTKIDTNQLLEANETLRAANEAIVQCADALARAVSTGETATIPDPSVNWGALLAQLTRALKTMEDAQERAVSLLFWRERAAQIFATAEQSIEGFFSSCSSASYASCGQTAAGWHWRYRRIPGVSTFFASVNLGQAIPTYLATMLGRSAGSGAESLQVQFQTNVLAAGLMPMVTHSYGPLFIPGTRMGDGVTTAVFAGIAAGTLDRVRTLLGRPTGRVFLTTIPSGVPDEIAGFTPLEFAFADRSGMVSRYLVPSENDAGWRSSLSLAGWIALQSSYQKDTKRQKVPAVRRPHQIESPLGADQVLSRMEQTTGQGEIEVLRHENVEGRSWSIVVRGTKSWSPLTGNPHDLLSNLQEVGGAGSDQRQAVVAAMEMAGVGSEEPVELVGHSQGGTVVANLAADDQFNTRFNVKTVLTAGSPNGGILPASNGVRTLSLENLNDVVPGLDGQANPIGSDNVTVYFDSAEDPSGNRDVGGGSAGAHAVSTYVEALKGLEGNEFHVEAKEFLDYRRSALLLDESTSSTVQYFQTTRTEERR